MIPIKDDIPSQSYPIVNVTLIIINIIAFIYELSLGEELQNFFNEYGIIPLKYFYEGIENVDGTVTYFSIYDRVIPIFTSMFLHGGWLHLISNMLYLWIFGDNVEDRMGHFRYLVFYILCGVAAAFAHIITNQNSDIPTIGASGAIAGVLGGYLLLYPFARIIVILPVFFFLQLLKLPALFVLGFWFITQIFQGTLSLNVESSASGGVAWWAHIGGFVFGLIAVNFFQKQSRKPISRDLF
jgi:membrane associated rhomboid family serine protease